MRSSWITFDRLSRARPALTAGAQQGTHRQKHLLAEADVLERKVYNTQ